MNAALVEELVRRQHPDLLIGSLREMPPGFDNTIWRLGDDLVVRLPRRQAGVHLIESEQRWLPGLAARLPLLIPAPLRIGVPSDLFPWPWTIARWIEGTPGNLVDPGVLSCLARPLGRFFRALHRNAPEDAPTNPFRDVPLRIHDDNVHHRLAEAAEAGDRAQLPRV